MSINWELGRQGNNALAYFQMGQQLGQQVLDGRLNRAVGKIMQADQPGQMPNGQAPDLSREWQTVAQNDPRLFGQLQQQRAAQAEAMRKRQAEEQQAQRGRVMEMAKLFDGVTPENYGQRLQIAQRMGIDTTGAPQTYDPNWVQENGLIMRFAAEKPEALSTFGKIAADEGLTPGTPQYNARVTELVKADALKTIPYTQGGGVAGFNPMTGETSTIVAPNPGGFAAGTPVSGGVQEGATATNPQTGQKIVFRNGQWQPMGGQPAGAGPFAQ